MITTQSLLLTFCLLLCISCTPFESESDSVGALAENSSSSENDKISSDNDPHGTPSSNNADSLSSSEKTKDPDTKNESSSKEENESQSSESTEEARNDESDNDARETIAEIKMDYSEMQAPFGGADGAGSGTGGGNGSGMGVISQYYPGTEDFSSFQLAGFVLTTEDNQSTYGLDVDAGSYTWARNQINYGYLPDSQSVRTEEFINYFRYDYAEPTDGVFSISTDISDSPFRDSVHIMRIGLKAATPKTEYVPWNITFLIDISGSMGSRLDLVKESLYFLIDNMRDDDFISITTYAGSVTTVLEPVSIKDKSKAAIKALIGDLKSGGGTSMSDGMTNAYETNQSAFLNTGVNRVIVCSDGDANIGSTRGEDMLKEIEKYVDEGIFMSTLGFGTGNYKDNTMEELANRGNGNYYYIDGMEESKRIFGEQLAATIQAVAIDAKIQVTFDESTVLSYRLLGYENRDIADTLFEVDSTDAGEIGQGHTVTALYELILAPGAESANAYGDIRIRFKDVEGETHEESIVIENNALSFTDQATDFQFSVLVGEYADILRKTAHSYTTLQGLWIQAVEWNLNDNDQRKEFYNLLEQATTLE